ncbi:HAMP domain-containing histidine kinase [Candidatus Kaiserbacteria bacterium]|nr:HAMP domain-containing histidine kinase [Candidatus Kaiserbacteria bacterium]
MESSSNLIACTDATANFVGLFDLSIAPPLLYYSYIPIIFISIFFSLFIFFKGGRSTAGKLLVWLSILFSVFLLNEIVQWTAVHANVVHFSWAMALLLQQMLFMLAVCFVAHFTLGLKFDYKVTSVFLVLLLPTFVLLPTTFNLVAFEIDNCESLVGELWYYLYFLEIFSIVATGVIGVLSLRRNKETRGQNVLLTVGSMVFLGLFSLSNIFGEITQVYEINLIGPLGAAVFLVLLGYMIVKYHTFNVKLFATEALVIGIAILIGARLFYSTNGTGFILSGTTLLAFLASGFFLVRSVRREIEDRVQISQLAAELELANEHQVSLIHFITHQVKGVLTKSRYIFGELEAGTYGALKPAVQKIVKEGYQFNTDGVHMVQDILHASNVKTGKVTYEKKPLNFKSLVETEAESQKRTAEDRGLTLTMHADPGDYMIEGDADQLAHAVRNLVDNAIKYTPKGSVAMLLARTKDSVRFSVKDSGIGIDEKDKEHIFTEGGRGEESQKINTDSTGYGLFIVKGIIETHGGKVWYESEGPGKGTTFFIELPRSHS